jgi:hypothetical protein
MPSMKSAPVVSLLVVAGALVVEAGCDDTPAPTLSTLKAEVFQPRCGATACHGADNAARGLDLVTDLHGALVDRPSVVDPSQRYVVAGDVENSLLLQVLGGPVRSADGARDCRQMPPGFPLDDATRARIEAWIAAGAADD